VRGQRGAHRRCSLPRTGWDLRPPARRTPLESPPRWTPPAATPATRAAGPWAQSAWRLGQHSDRGSGCQMARLQLPACSTRRRRAAFTASQHRYVSMIRRSSTPGCGLLPIAPPQRVLSKPLGFMCVHVLHPTTLLTPPFRHCPFCGRHFPPPKMSLVLPSADTLAIERSILRTRRLCRCMLWVLFLCPCGTIKAPPRS
jgi:hypothetical protein